MHARRRRCWPVVGSSGLDTHKPVRWWRHPALCVCVALACTHQPQDFPSVCRPSEPIIVPVPAIISAAKGRRRRALPAMGEASFGWLRAVMFRLLTWVLAWGKFLTWGFTWGFEWVFKWALHVFLHGFYKDFTWALHFFSTWILHGLYEEFYMGFHISLYITFYMSFRMDFRMDFRREVLFPLVLASPSSH